MKSGDQNENFSTELERLCNGLIFVSETDAKVEPFSGGKLLNVGILNYKKALGLRATESIEEIEFDEFFERLTRKQDWHGEAERKRARQFSKLRDLLKKNLSDLKVFRVGKIRIDIYVVGTDVTGRLVGIKTKAIET